MKLRPAARPRLLVEELERRILFSADTAALLGLAGTAHGAEVRLLEPLTAAPPVVQPSATAQQSSAREIVFIDSRVPDAMKLADQLMQQRGDDRVFDIVVLDANEDGIAQIDRILAGEHDLAAIHIISHGSDGAIEIGSTQLDAARLAIDAKAVAQWGRSLTVGGDLLLYGCDVAQDAAGQAFVQSLARLTGADVAASVDATGSVALGGNWDLEFNTGPIQTQVAPSAQAQEQWQGVLDAPVAVNDAYSVNEDSTLVVAPSTANLANLWGFNEGGSTQTISSSGSLASSATLGSTAGVDAADPTWTTGYVGGSALAFNGAGQYVDTTSTDLKTASNFTLSAWFQTNTTTGAQHLLWEGYPGGNGYGNGGSTTAATSEMSLSIGSYTAAYDNKIVFFLGYDVPANGADCIFIASASNFTDTGNWHNVAVTVSDLGGGVMSASLYVDGKLEGTDTGSQNDRSVWGALRIGATGDGTRSFNGKIDDVRVYSTALAAGSVQGIATAGVLANDTDPDSATLKVNTAVVTSPTHGTLNISSDGSFTYTPTANYFGTDSFTYKANDDVVNSNVATVTITVNPVADTPSVTNATANEDTQSTTGLVISRNAADGAEVGYFQITGITNGTLYQNDGTTAIANNSFITFAQGNAGLKFTPATNFNGNGSFTVQASTTNAVGGLGGSTVNATITVNPVNDAPVQVFTGANFTGVYAYNDASGNWFVQNTPVDTGTIQSKPQGAALHLSDSAGGSSSSGVIVYFDGSLKLGDLLGGSFASTGSALAMNIYLDTGNDGQFFSFSGAQFTGLNGDSYATVALGANGGAFNDNTVFTKAAGIAALPSTFTLAQLKAGAVPGIDVNTRVALWIGGGNAFSSDISNVSVAARTAGSLTVQEDSGLTTLGLGGAAFGPGGGADEAGQTLTYAVTAVPNAAVGSVVLADGTTVVTASTGYSLAQIQGMQFKTAANANGAGGAFSFSVQDSGGTLNGGVNTITQALALNVTAVNDAPVASGSATLAAINEDTASPAGATVSSLFAANFSDSADQVTGGSSANTFAGIAIGSYTVDAAKGNWQYSTNTGGSWTTLGSATTSAAITLDAAASTMLRFVPAANYAGAATALSANLIESGQVITNGATLNLTGATGTTTHVSAATVALGETITAVNDAPVLVSGNALAPINENPASNPGTLVSALISGQVSDADSGALTGIAVTAVDNSHGSWQYSTDSGTTWLAFGTPSAASSRLLAADAGTFVRFVPNTGWSGAVGNGITFRAWDQSVGSAGTNADTSANGGTTAFSLATASTGITVNATGSITGTVYEDLNGDSNLADAVGAANVTVRLYRDDGSGAPDAGDTLVATTFTSAGSYSFSGLADATYWVAVDSRTITPSAGFNVGFGAGDVWAEQTYGAAGSVGFSGGTYTFSAAAGSFFGGMHAGVSDAAATLATAEHVTREVTTGSTIAGVNSAFSFNVITTTRGGDSSDDDGSANRTVQGSLRQFIQNADAISGVNAMRFVPTTATNATDGAGNNWWRIDVTNVLPSVTDAGTTLDGMAYSAADGTTVRDTNAGQVGTGGTVGVDGLTLDRVNRPELEIAGSALNAPGITVDAASGTVRNLAIDSFVPNGGGAIYAGAQLRITSAATSAGGGVIVSGNLIGMHADGTNPGVAQVYGININGAATVTNNFIAFVNGNGVMLSDAWMAQPNTQPVTFADNEMAYVGDPAAGGGDMLSDISNGAVIRGNYLHDFIGNQPAQPYSGKGIEVWYQTQSALIENNTIANMRAAGIGVNDGSQNNTIRRNIITGTTGDGVYGGAGILITSFNDTATSPPSGNRITENSIYANAGLGIDIDARTAVAGSVGDGVTANDAGDVDTGGNGLQNFPVLSAVATTGSQIAISGTLNSTANSYYRIEFFANATADGSGHGEGQRFIGFANVSTDGAGNATISTTLSATVAVGEFITATATKSNATFTTFTDTSEFAQDLTATAWLTATNMSVAETYTEDIALNLTDIVVGTTSATATANLTLSNAAAGSLNTATSGSVTSTFAAGVWTASGALANVNTLLSGLTFTPTANFNGNFTIATNVSDGVAAPVTGTKAITGSAVADTPSVTNASTNEDTQSTSGLVISRNAADGAEVGYFQITGISNGTLYQNDGTTAIANNSFITFAQGNAGLKFTPATNFNGNGSFTVQASTTNGVGGLGGGTVDATITVNPVNDAPTGSVTLAGTPTQGLTLSVTDTLADADGLGTITYHWYAGAVDTGASGSSYVLAEADVGKTFSVRATYTDGHGTNESVTSNSLGPVANVNDAPTGAVTLSGTPTQGQTLSVTDTLADADGLGPITYHWYSGAVDTGATGTSYVLAEADVGRTFSVHATYTDGHGTNESVTSNSLGPVANVNDAPTGSVTLTGTPTQGQTLTVSNTLADADGLGTIAYHWYAGAVDTGATGASYVLAEADVGKTFSVRATYTDGHGTNESVTSNSLGPVANVNDAPTGAVTLSGTPTQGQTLSVTDTLADADGLGPITYHWYAGAVDTGATGSNYVLAEADVGKTFSVRATYTDGHGTNESVTSNSLGPVANVNDAPTGSVTLTGTPTQGQTLSVTDNLADADGLGTITYHWYAGAVDTGATGSSYVLAEADVGQTVSVRATYTDGHGTAESVTSNSLGPVANVNDAPTGSVTLAGTPTQGQTLSVTNTLADPDGLGTITYHWYAGAVDTGATGGSYVLAEADVGQTFSVVATYTDGHGTPESVASNSLGPVANVNDAPTTSAVTLTAIVEDSGARIITQAELLANAADVDGPSLAATNLAIGSGAGTLVDNGNGSWTYTPAANDDSSVSFIYDVTDGSLTAAGSATLDITPVNDAPTTNIVTLAAVAEDSGARLITQADLLANASDVDGPSLSATGLAISSGAGTLIDNGNGTWSYTPAPNDDSSVSFSYTVTDGSLSAAGSVSLDITPVNDAPTTSPVTLAPIAEDSGVRLITQAELLANATDIDGPSLSATGLAISSGSGTLVDNGNGTWSYTPAANDDTAVSFTYTVTDGSLNAAGSASLDITPVNDAPTTSTVTLAAIAEDSGARVITQAELLANAADVDGPSLAATNLAISNGAGTLVDNGNGTWTYTPAANDDTAVNFSYTVTDGSLAAAGTASLDITPVNDAPVITTATMTLQPSQALVLSSAQLKADDVDSNTAALVFDVRNVTAGQFEFVAGAGVPITQFTQAQVAQGDVRFVYTDVAQIPSFDVTAFDGSARSASISVVASVTAAPAAAAPPSTTQPGESTQVAKPPVEANLPAAPATAGNAGKAPTASGDRILAPGSQDVALALDGAQSVFGPASTSPARTEQQAKVMHTQQELLAKSFFDLDLRIADDAYLTRVAYLPITDLLQSGAQYLHAGSSDTQAQGSTDTESHREQAVTVTVQVARASGVALSVGAVWWALRAGGLVASLLGTLPMWRHVDLLAVLPDEEEEDDWDADVDDEARRDEKAVGNVFAAANDGEPH